MRSRKYSGPRRNRRLAPAPVVLRRVNGNSMLPTLADGQLVVARQTRDLTVGDVVIVTHDGLEKIKRIEHHEGDLVYLLGDNPSESTDSRTLGWLPAKTISAKVIWPKLTT
ncbi:S26 family signal peptidase [Aeromicrobium sp.]|nr:S26 family signal peptidase [Candidatus Saccharibacteria bacterium]